jgi:hypothetical protein
MSDFGFASGRPFVFSRLSRQRGRFDASTGFGHGQDQLFTRARAGRFSMAEVMPAGVGHESRLFSQQRRGSGMTAVTRATEERGRRQGRTQAENGRKRSATGREANHGITGR